MPPRRPSLHCPGLGEADDARLGVYSEAADRWKRIATIQLSPEFEDYAGVAVAGDLIAVVSQQSSALPGSAISTR